MSTDTSSDQNARIATRPSGLGGVTNRNAQPGFADRTKCRAAARRHLVVPTVALALSDLVLLAGLVVFIVVIALVLMLLCLAVHRGPSTEMVLECGVSELVDRPDRA